MADHWRSVVTTPLVHMTEELGRVQRAAASLVAHNERAERALVELRTDWRRIRQRLLRLLSIEDDSETGPGIADMLDLIEVKLYALAKVEEAARQAEFDGEPLSPIEVLYLLREGRRNDVEVVAVAARPA